MAKVPSLFFAPFVSSIMTIEAGWIDFRGHLNMAYYHVLLDRAMNEAFDLIGLQEDLHATRGATTFAAENHIVYHRDLKFGDPVRATAQLIDFDATRLHVYLELRQASEGWLAASAESLFVHADLQTREAVPFPQAIQDNLMVMRAAHARLPKPSDLTQTPGIAKQKSRLN
ncbi:thioesterase family protein [Methylovirgula sp. 4M-Z18]|uniref:thioesterase family protein n=1 Tax=Methylovirgula sp. 4M-Z18 TaxID=2293567 RepID=UPI000E2F3467|nr:thioesterase family protein [Methylovirgula sp. 4M-Z18]RFB79585.1 thioesterase [Methylovirgula sp. 4M-Z18]